MSDREDAIALGVGIAGLQEIQAECLRMVEALQPRDGLGRALKVGAAQAHRGVITRTHVDSGALRASQLVEVRGAQAIVFSDPRAHNPFSGGLPSEYEFFEDRRGGGHAAKRNTVEQDGQAIVLDMARALIGAFGA